jgi:hypothetical protein
MTITHAESKGIMNRINAEYYYQLKRREWKENILFKNIKEKRNRRYEKIEEKREDSLPIYYSLLCVSMKHYCPNLNCFFFI